MSNPFSTRYVRPGAARYIYPPGENSTTLVARLRAGRWTGEIVGPHGSGKSTLLAELLEAIQAELPRVASFSLHDGQRRLPLRLGALAASAAGPPQVVAVDGYEQLGRWQRWRLRRWCRRHGCGLVTTSHEPTGLPVLFRTRTTPELAVEAVRRLLAPDDRRIDEADVRRCFAQHGGNLRETLFALYGIYERRRKAVVQGQPGPLFPM